MHSLACFDVALFWKWSPLAKLAGDMGILHTPHRTALAGGLLVLTGG